MVATDKPSYRVIGTRPVRHDGVEKVTGRAQYGADLRLPGTLYGRVMRSPHAHARIKRIDTSKAEALPGVKAAITFADFPHPGDRIYTFPMGGEQPLYPMVTHLMADKKVLFRGHPVAAVCASDPHVAEDALELIEVEYEVLEPVLDVREAMLDSAPLLHEDMITADPLRSSDAEARPSNIALHIFHTVGEVNRAFEEADVVVEGEFSTTMAHQGYIEPHVATAMWRSDGHLTIWTSHQGHFWARHDTASMLDLPVSRVTVVPLEIGGGFGAKTKVYLEPLAALLSKKTGRPVKMTMTRQEVLEATGPTSGAHMRAKVGAKRDGTIIAGEGHFAFEAGAYPGAASTHAAVRCAFTPYDIPNLLVEAWDVVLNKPQTAPYRAPGAPASEFAIESLVDELAERLDMDPMELRLKNATREGSRSLDGVRFGPIGNVEVMEAIKNSDHYRSELQGEHRGRGVAMGFWTNYGMQSAVYASVHADGTVSLVTGSVDIGGVRVVQAMQLAETLGIPVEDVNPIVADTDQVGYNDVTAGSRSAFATGWASYECGMDIRRQLEGRAAAIWEADGEAVHYDDGVIRGPDGQKLTFKELAAQLPYTGGLVQGRASVAPGQPGPAFAGHIVDVEVDPDTGKVTILRYTAVQDVGTAIHPSYVEGQMQGGAMQGIGMALTEEYLYSDDGTMLNSSLLDYRQPTAVDLPMIETILIEVPNPGHPYGVRGVAELPIVPPLAAVANAIHDATGARARRLPATARVMLELLKPEG